jgi:hypothetical protein
MLFPKSDSSFAHLHLALLLLKALLRAPFLGGSLVTVIRSYGGFSGRIGARSNGGCELV